MPKFSPNNLIWVDCEMTGLDLDSDRLLEVACVVTDKDLTVIGKLPEMVLHQDEKLLAGMNDWCKKTHGKTGLTEECRKSKLTEADVDDALLRFVEEYAPKGEALIAGSSIGCDLVFLRKFCPRFTGHLHYRVMDVSTIKELCRRWYPSVPVTPDQLRPKDETVSHRAMSDILDSIARLKYYKETIFKVV